MDLLKGTSKLLSKASTIGTARTKYEIGLEIISIDFDSSFNATEGNKFSIQVYKDASLLSASSEKVVIKSESGAFSAEVTPGEVLNFTSTLKKDYSGNVVEKKLDIVIRDSATNSTTAKWVCKVNEMVSKDSLKFKAPLLSESGTPVGNLVLRWTSKESVDVSGAASPGRPSSVASDTDSQDAAKVYTVEGTVAVNETAENAPTEASGKSGENASALPVIESAKPNDAVAAAAFKHAPTNHNSSLETIVALIVVLIGVALIELQVAGDDSLTKKYLLGL